MFDVFDTKIVNASVEQIANAAALIKRGEVVAIPTETVYGLAANALNPDAVSKIFVAKGRPQDNPLIVHVSSFEEIYQLVSEISENAKKLADAFWPGPLTMIFKKNSVVPNVVSAGLTSVAVRMPNHAVALEIIKSAGTPLAAPSANTSGRPSPTRAIHVLKDLDGKIPLIIDGGECAVGLESTVVDMTSQPPTILRPGAVSAEMMRDVIGEVALSSFVMSEVKSHEKVRSPGMKYLHYAPKASLVLVKGEKTNFVKFVNSQNELENDVFVLCFDDELDMVNAPALSMGDKNAGETHAKRIFSLLRTVDEMNVSKIYCHAPSLEGIDFAVYNRLLRASGFEVVYV